ncbi:MAG: helix-turn-helix transcriptional regulator [Capsulimonadaceae bacterium]|nr:helix-turn-helix transcriptional regulator [Capsulimonadaceae bacterium]
MLFAELDLTPPTSGGVALYPAGATFGPRRMREWEFVWIMQGDTRYYCDGVAVDAPTGSIVLCRPSTTDSFQWDRKRETRHAYFHFGVRSLPAAWANSGWPLSRDPLDGDLLVVLFRYVLTRLDRGDPDEVTLAIAQMLAAYRSGDRSTDLRGQSAHSTAVTMVCDYIRRRLDEAPSEPISLTDMADVAHVTPAHLCRLFQAALGQPPGRLVRSARLDRAATLVTHSNYSITEIADLCGYANPFHFSRRFKDAFGQSPTVVRQQIRDGSLTSLPSLPRDNS